MQGSTVLICDDNPAVAESLTGYLEEERFSVLAVPDGESALRELARQQVDIVVLDIMLPGISGLDVCREIRKSSDIPIIMLSARGTELDRVLGLEIGADDYVTKPFSPREVMVRVKRILQRTQAREEPRTLSFAGLSVLPEEHLALVEGEKISLTNKETKVLAYLVTHPDKVITREQILNAGWSYEYYGDMRAVDTMIKRIRQKITLPGARFTIRSVYGVGYKLEARA